MPTKISICLPALASFPSAAHYLFYLHPSTGLDDHRRDHPDSLQIHGGCLRASSLSAPEQQHVSYSQARSVLFAHLHFEDDTSYLSGVAARSRCCYPLRDQFIVQSIHCKIKWLPWSPVIRPTDVVLDSVIVFPCRPSAPSQPPSSQFTSQLVSAGMACSGPISLLLSSYSRCNSRRLLQKFFSHTYPKCLVRSVAVAIGLLLFSLGGVSERRSS